jgi:hypothetical protein
MRVLVVEDERQMASQLRKGLEREGYAVLLAHEGGSARSRPHGCARRDDPRPRKGFDEVIVGAAIETIDDVERRIACCEHEDAHSHLGLPQPARYLTWVWGYGASIESNTLDAFIHLLRGKVEMAPGCKLIHTVRGVGYSLREAPPP